MSGTPRQHQALTPCSGRAHLGTGPMLGMSAGDRQSPAHHTPEAFGALLHTQFSAHLVYFTYISVIC